ncbi:hypothetical protein GQ457_18G011230 [Hibiscus cannabinus]
MTRVRREEDKPDAIYETNSSKFTTIVHHGGSFYRTSELIYTANDNDVLEMVSKLPRNHYVHVYLEEVLTACSDANVEPDCNVEVSDAGSFEPEINVEVSDVAGSFEPDFNVEDNDAAASFEPDCNPDSNCSFSDWSPWDCGSLATLTHPYFYSDLDPNFFPSPFPPFCYQRNPNPNNFSDPPIGPACGAKLLFSATQSGYGSFYWE